MCFDVSHTMLTCNYFKQDFYEFAKKIAPYTAHIHMGDATGLNGEGLQIGEGEIDFVKLGKIAGAGDFTEVAFFRFKLSDRVHLQLM